MSVQAGREISKLTSKWESEITQQSTPKVMNLKMKLNQWIQQQQAQQFNLFLLETLSIPIMGQTQLRTLQEVYLRRIIRPEKLSSRRINL